MAVHSQESHASMDILPIIFNDSILKNQLIAAYLIGRLINLEYLENHSEIVVCEDSSQTGCIISWNTKTKHAGTTITNKPCLCIKPLSRTQDEAHVSYTQNKIAVFYLAEDTDSIPHYIEAQYKNGIIV